MRLVFPLLGRLTRDRVAGAVAPSKRKPKKMKKASKNASKSVAEVKKPEPTIPPIWRERLNRSLERRIEDLTGPGSNVARFFERAKESLADAFTWTAEDAVRDDETARTFQKLLRFSTTPFGETRDGFEAGKVPNDAKIHEAIVRMADEIKRDLLGDSFYVSSRGPWSLNSTSAGVNFAAVEKANSSRFVYAFYVREIENYETRAKFDMCVTSGFSNAVIAADLEKEGFPFWTESDVSLYLAAKRDLEAEAKRKADAEHEARVSAGYADETARRSTASIPGSADFGVFGPRGESDGK